MPSLEGRSSVGQTADAERAAWSVERKWIVDVIRRISVELAERARYLLAALDIANITNALFQGSEILFESVRQMPEPIQQIDHAFIGVVEFRLLEEASCLGVTHQIPPVSQLEPKHFSPVSTLETSPLAALHLGRCAEAIDYRRIP
jgi:hypothetical protein